MWKSQAKKDTFSPEPNYTPYILGTKSEDRQQCGKEMSEKSTFRGRKKNSSRISEGPGWGWGVGDGIQQ